MLKVAITGNIAAGKSVVENYLEKQGYKVFDTDKMAHSVLKNSPKIPLIFKDFDIYSDGIIDRKKIAKIVFENKEMLKKLEEIIHPEIKLKLEEIFNRDYDIVFVSVPLLFESGFDKMFDKIILVSADENIRLKRIMERNNLSKEDAIMRIKSQIPEDEKYEKCDIILKNNSSKENLETLVKAYLKNIKDL